MKTTFQGRGAESAVAKLLKSQKYEILAQNWRTRVCEIDVVAKKDKIIYFVEVKYRGRDDQGSGLEYITPKKLNQIKFAAQVWCAQDGWDGDYRLLGAEVSGPSYEHIEIVELT